ncbi:MAG: hypothetical protein IJL87_05845 [Clostridia bacterium]|nr:hypothetical protein [Clostridia bacterium]
MDNFNVSKVGMLVITIYLVFLGILLLLSLAAVIIKAIYAKNTGVKNWGLVFLPIGTDYVTGKLADMYSDKKFRIWLPIVSAAALVVVIGLFTVYGAFFGTVIANPNAGENIILKFIPVFMIFILLANIVSIASAILNIFAYFNIFSYKNKENAAVWTVLYALLGIPAIIFMLVYAKKPGHSKIEQSAISEQHQ